ncbi:NUDIX domain-containing protein [Planococcus sp. N028]|uniref:NUDIX domain-containing protein n=1 Tax=Planococcus shixiaomingii TaxID=3058393 RepID=A0ABT8N587_9BACL|nr:NUDIX domain-containing protein [Planococcus sp. N028]MDN7243047.1 NUDIX domain-containing protein [Planococcus sp. N028]
MRDRSSVILIQEGKVALIKRVFEGDMYYVFPGGGVDPGETPEQAARREAFEELGVEVEVQALVAVVEHNGTQFFFSAQLLSGEIGTGRGEEFTNLKRDRGTYEPMWIDIAQLQQVNVKPREVAEKV